MEVPTRGFRLAGDQISQLLVKGVETLCHCAVILSLRMLEENGAPLLAKTQDFDPSPLDFKKALKTGYCRLDP
jgi:hypothetical protein